MFKSVRTKIQITDKARPILIRSDFSVDKGRRAWSTVIQIFKDHRRQPRLQGSKTIHYNWRGGELSIIKRLEKIMTPIQQYREHWRE